MTAATCPTACGTAASTPANTYTCTRKTVKDLGSTDVSPNPTPFSDAYCTDTKPSSTTSCAATSLCPIDGTWSTWSTWTACSKSCGPGTQTKTRTCDGRAHGGADCVGSTSKVGNCNLGSCVTYSWSKTAASCPTACGTAASSPAD